MLIRVAATLVCAVVLVSGSACAPGAVGTAAPDGVPPVCPFNSSVSMVVGDSVAAEWQKYVTWPQGTIGFSTAYGGAGYTVTNPALNLEQRLQRQVASCGAGLGNVILHGGIADLARGQPVEPLIAAVSALSEELDSQGISVTWLTITPFSDFNRPGGDIRDINRAAFNEWLATPGNVQGRVVDCNSSIADPARPEFLAPAFHWLVAPFQVDHFHPNVQGYRAYAACVSEALASAPA
jgi:lysophospholipase L1-like esterase